MHGPVGEPGDGQVGPLVGVPRGELWVLAEAPGLQRASSRLVVLGERRAVRLVLRPAQRLVVRVTDDEGKPLGVLTRHDLLGVHV